jgi:hypothetical protein
MMKALIKLVDGAWDEAREMAEKALGSARLLHARPAIAAAEGVLAEIAIRSDPLTGPVEAEARLAGVDVPSAGVARALALRPRALMGDAGARDEVVAIAARLTAPSLSRDLPGA